MMKTGVLKRYMIIAISVDLRYIPERHRRRTHFGFVYLELSQRRILRTFLLFYMKHLKKTIFRYQFIMMFNSLFHVKKKREKFRRN